MRLPLTLFTAACSLSSLAPAQGLISRHQLNEGVGATVANNFVQSAPDAAYLNGVVLEGWSSPTGSGVTLDGVDDRVDFTGDTRLNSLSDNFTVSCWVKAQNAALLPRQTFVGCYSWSFGVQFTPLVTPTPELVLAINTGAGVSTITVPCSCAINLGVEYFVSMVVAPGGAITFYAQDAMFSGGAVPLASLPAGSAGPLPTAGAIGQWTIGGSQVGLSNPLSGSIADVQIFDRALSASELELLFDSPGSTFGIGSTFCTAVNNSTGTPGQFDVFGSAIYSVNDLQLTATSLPPGQFCYSLATRDGAMTPGSGVTLPGMSVGGSVGPLCLAGSLNRINSPIGLVGTDGSYTRTIDLTSSIGALNWSAAAGETWNFQLWHRDWDTAAGVPLSNFTNGVSITLL